MTVAVSKPENVQDRVADPASDQLFIGIHRIRVDSPYGVAVTSSPSLRQPRVWRSFTQLSPAAPTPPKPREADGSLADSIPAADFSVLPETERRILQTLAALNNAPLSAARLTKLTGTNDVMPAITALQERNWLCADADRYWLVQGMRPLLAEAYDLTSLRAWALLYFSRAIKEQLTPQNLADAIEAIASLVTWTIQSERWSETIRLVQGVEKTLLYSQSWPLWRQMLNQVLIAAAEIEDFSRQAWAWHQLGSLALCQEDVQTARTALMKALQLRRSLGEDEAAALTLANLNQARAFQPSLPMPQNSLRLPLLAGLILGLTIVAVSLVWGGDHSVRAVNQTTAAITAQSKADLPTPTSTTAPQQIAQQIVAGDRIAAASTVTETPMPSPTPCIISAPARWQKTAIRQGDTLGKLAVAHRTVVDEIMRANCLPNDLILAGSQLWLPPLPPTPTPTIPPANLLVNGVWLNGQPSAGADAIIVPVAIALANEGGRPADYSIVSASYSTEGGSERMPITFRSAAAPASIEPGQQVPAIGGTVAFSPSLSNQMVTLWVTAHSEKSTPINLTLPSPVVRIDSVSASGGVMAALLYNEGTEQWYTELSLAGHLDNEAAFQVQSWEWRNGDTIIGTGPTVMVRLSSDTDCVPYNITLKVTVAYFGGAYTMSESAGIRSDCASN